MQEDGIGSSPFATLNHGEGKMADPENALNSPNIGRRWPA
jgi:hypothetical protein